MSSLQDEWLGAADESFNTQYTDLRPSLEQTAELLATLSTQLNQTANIYEEADTEIAGKFRV